jgi:hypothetical protein
MTHSDENSRSAVLTDWALARDLLARTGGKAGYLSVGTAAGHDRWLVIDLPLFSTVQQISYPVDDAFITAWPLPPYLGARVAVPNNETALALYGNYIAIERAMTASVPTAPLFDSDAERATVARRSKTAAARRTSGRKIGIISRTPPRALPVARGVPLLDKADQE